MDLALAIIFLWLGAALLFVAFHPLSGESGSDTPGGVIKSIQADISKSNPSSGS